MHSAFDTRVFRNECRSLAAEGYDVILCIPHDKEEIVDGVKIIPLRRHKGFLDRIYGAPKYASKIADKLDADLYHFHDPELLFEMAGLAKRGKRVVWDAHENYSDTIFQFNSLRAKPISFLGAKLFGIYELKYASKYFKGVVTITDTMAKKYLKRGINTAVVGNFSNLDQFSFPDFEKPQTPLRFISSGMQFRVRGVVEIASAFNLLSPEAEAELCYAGKIKSEDLRDEILAEIDQYRINDVTFTGPLEWKDLINSYLPSAHVAFVLFDTSDPNNCNGLPNRFFEAWSNGIPVITTSGTQVALLTQQENGGIVIPDNSPESIKKAMESFISNPGLARELGENGFKAVQTKYSWSVAAQNLSVLYNQILS